MNQKQTAAEIVLSEMLYRNPLHNDYDGYMHELAMWGLRLVSEKPVASDFGQHETAVSDIDDYIGVFKLK